MLNSGYHAGMAEPTTAPTRSRRTPEDRRKQLIGIGLQLLTTVPIQQLTIDEVAKVAGISRSLLFHYFPTKRDYYVAVVRAASHRLLKSTRHDPELPPAERLTGVLTGYVSFIDRRREPYLALFRGTSGDDWAREIYEETRDQLTTAALAAAGRADCPDLVRMAVRGWLSYVEDVTLGWSEHKVVDRDVLVAMFVAAFDALTGQADAASGA